VAWIAAAWFASWLPGASRVDASEAPELLAAAARAYEANDFSGAVAAYESLRTEGYGGSDLLYNLGNSYFKAGDLGRAIANYERALLLAPRDHDLIENLAIARERCVDKRPENAIGAGALVSTAIRTLTPDEWAAAFVAGLLLTLATVLVPLYTRVEWKALRSVTVFGAGLLILGTVGISVWARHSRPGSRAVVVARPDATEVSVRSGPGAAYLGEFALHPGSVVRVIDEREGWVKISFSPSLRGWAEAGGFERL